MAKAAPVWLVPVAAIFVLQTTTSFLARFIPIIAPAISEEFGWSGSSIGYLTTAYSLGGLAMLAAGSNLIRQVGGLRLLHLSLFLSAAVMVFFLHPNIGLALAACFVMGLSNGTAQPAGSEVLQRFSPPSKRNLRISNRRNPKKGRGHPDSMPRMNPESTRRHHPSNQLKNKAAASRPNPCPTVIQHRMYRSRICLPSSACN